MLQTKTMVNAYTWTTLPLYTIIQRPWQRLNRSKSFNVKSYVDKQGRTIYYRPTPADITHKYLKYTTFAEIVNTLDRNREVVGQRDVIKEHVALDENGKPVKIDGKVLKKVELSKEFRWKTVGEVLDHVDSLAKGLLQLGVKRGDKVLIYAENGIEWFYTCLALVRINAVTVTLFSTLGDSGLVYGINQCDAQYVITSQSLLKNLDKLSKQFNQLRTIVYIEDQKCDCNQVVNSLIEKKFQVKSYREIEENGSKLPPIEYSNPNPDETLLIMYTSGTTGNPKGVIITHGQFVQSLHNLLRKDLENDSMAFESTFAAYLPMAHLFGYMMNIGMFVSDSKIAFCSPFSLLDSSPAHVPGQVGDIKLIEPEFLVGVPIVLERILKEIYRKLNAQSPIAEPLFTYLMDYKIRWTARGYQTPIINKLVCKKINDQFGGKLRIMAVSSAPLHERTHSLMEAALNVRIVEVYGSTEMTGGSHVVSMHDLSYGNVGVPYHSFKYYLKDWTEGGYSVNDKPNPRGEIVTSSNTIANGYYKLPEETEEAFTKDEDGTKWYHSGDIGEVLPNGTLKVIDRKKDLNKLANGEFVSLGKIESGLRNSIYVENMCICTDRYSNHVVAIISPNRLALSELASRLSKSHLSHEEMCNDPDINDHVLKSIKRFSKELGFKIREIPVAIKLVPEEWSQENNLLTAAFKMKRKQVNDYYKGQIEAMFSNE